jgi:hypothetical protein
MPIAVVTQIRAGCGIVRAVSLRAVSDRIIGPRLAVGDGASDNSARSKPAEHRRARTVVPAMVPAVAMIMWSTVPAPILYVLDRLGPC